MSSGGVNLR